MAPVPADPGAGWDSGANRKVWIQDSRNLNMGKRVMLTNSLDGIVQHYISVLEQFHIARDFKHGAGWGLLRRQH